MKFQIYSRDIDEPGTELKWTIPDNMVPGSLAVDYVANNLYVIDSLGDQIYVFDIDTMNYTVILSTYISHSLSTGLKDIVLDPLLG